MKAYYILLFGFIMLVGLACRKHVVVKNYQLDGPNQALKFTFLDTNAFKKRFNPDSVVFGYHTPNWIYIKQNGQKKYLNYTFFSKYSSAAHNRETLPMDFYFIISDVPSKVLKEKVYMEWPKGKVDTLLVDYFIAQENPDLPNTCNCWTPLWDLHLNGKKYLKKTNFDKNGIFLLE